VGTIFISYRRGEDAGYAGWLCDILERKLPNHELFLDIHRIDYGSDFRQEIGEWVESCDAFVAIIGRGWAEKADLIGARRLDDGEDLVRIEIETALRRKPPIPVIPVVLPGATLPLVDKMPVALHPLLRRNALETTHARFRQYCEELAQSIDHQITKEVIATSQVDEEDSRVDYWAAFSTALRAKNWPMPLRDEPPRTGFYCFTLDSKRGVYLYAYRDVIRRCIGAYIGLALAGPIAKIVFDTWKSQHVEIEARFGERLAWKQIQPPRNYHIQIDLEAVDPINKGDWNHQHDWLSDRLLRLYNVFYPKINELPPKEELMADANRASGVIAATAEG
jgi:hypothetical protein